MDSSPHHEPVHRLHRASRADGNFSDDSDNDNASVVSTISSDDELAGKAMSEYKTRIEGLVCLFPCTVDSLFCAR